MCAALNRLSFDVLVVGAGQPHAPKEAPAYRLQFDVTRGRRATFVTFLLGLYFDTALFSN